MTPLQQAADQAERGDSLLVVYVGHGAYWADVPGAQVHFAPEYEPGRRVYFLDPTGHEVELVEY